MVLVDVDGLRKSYRGVTAVDDVSFGIEAGEVFGLVGPNGAGKSTTLRVLTTLIDADDGHVTVCGADVAGEPETVRSRVGYLPEEAGAYETLTGREYLRFVADLYADGATVDEMVDRGAEIAGLDDRLADKTGDYSKGMTRRLLVARTLMTRPRLAVLDEATSGLDVVNSREVREVIRGVPDDDRAVLLSSHDMLEVESLCDRVALLNEGRIVARGPPGEVIAEYGARTLEDAFVEAVA
jgi:ABC-2 type transport system ATP-binding protein